MSSSNDPAAGFNERFFRYFQHEVTALQEQMDRLATTSIVGGERNDAVDHCLAGIARLSQEVKDASSYLPAYDQRTYGEAVKALTEKLNTVRNSFAPRPKFTFKSALKTRARPTPAPPPPPSESPITNGTNGTSTITNSTNSNSEDAITAQINDLLRQTTTPTIQRPSFDASSSISITNQASIYAAIQAPSRGRPGGRAAKVTDNSESVIDLREIAPSTDPFASVTIKDVEKSVVLCGNVSGPVHITGVKNSVLVMNCRQFRMHECTDVKVYLYASSRPIIEDCKEIGFAPLPLATGGGEVEKENMWDQVDDFKWLKAEQSPNWRLIKEDDRFGKEIWETIKGEESVDALGTALKAFGLT
ncbi:TBCC-domain-containing protein [Microthyrium microscopicum]|uniref:TBCC-domain-containing protein n=1 Tax=Microthyrium microscopicum TaxID=703497 RepID=A0A6A6UHW9_9PEZI|nr:TBCC-domain-containing protein [Microthyrium microscopicum]